MAVPERRHPVRTTIQNIFKVGTLYGGIRADANAIADNQYPLSWADGFIRNLVNVYPEQSRELAERTLVPLVDAYIRFFSLRTDVGLEALATATAIFLFPPTRRGLGKLKDRAI
ncbi:MAG: hypothetical protein KGL95_10420, partial [Patescibacteria group bacterium]|nr:hypothetical protein [Patescibacteria group bacterium]